MDKIELLERLHKQMIAEIMDYAIILMDLDGTILTWNAGAEKIKGYKENEIVGQNFRLFYMPEDRQAQLPEQLINIAKKEGRARHIGRRVRKDGSVFWGSILITALHDENGKVSRSTKPRGSDVARYGSAGGVADDGEGLREIYGGDRFAETGG